jgi:hypothetical protein
MSFGEHKAKATHVYYEGLNKLDKDRSEHNQVESIIQVKH